MGEELASLSYWPGFEHVNCLLFSASFIFLGMSLLFSMTQGLYCDT